MLKLNKFKDFWYILDYLGLDFNYSIQSSDSIDLQAYFISIERYMTGDYQLFLEAPYAYPDGIIYHEYNTIYDNKLLKLILEHCV